MIKTKQADGKGRVNLGPNFANRTVIIRETDATEVVVTLARIMPEREAWLHENQVAKAMVREGLEQVAKGEFAASPDLAADAALADELDGEA